MTREEIVALLAEANEWLARPEVFHIPEDLVQRLTVALGEMLNAATLDDIRQPSVAIERLIEEVRVEKEIDRPWGGYNRTYHRHNR